MIHAIMKRINHIDAIFVVIGIISIGVIAITRLTHETKKILPEPSVVESNGKLIKVHNYDTASVINLKQPQKKKAVPGEVYRFWYTPISKTYYVDYVILSSKDGFVAYKKHRTNISAFENDTKINKHGDEWFPENCDLIDTISLEKPKRKFVRMDLKRTTQKWDSDTLSKISPSVPNRTGRLVATLVDEMKPAPLVDVTIQTHCLAIHKNGICPNDSNYKAFWKTQPYRLFEGQNGGILQGEYNVQMRNDSIIIIKIK